MSAIQIVDISNLIADLISTFGISDISNSNNYNSNLELVISLIRFRLLIGLSIIPNSDVTIIQIVDISRPNCE